MTWAARAAYEELLLSPVGALARYRDGDGRPLCGEAIVTDSEFRRQLELRRCPYPGSRRHHALPMNVSALKQMTRSWPLLLGTAQLLCRMFGRSAAGTPTTARLMRVAYGAVCLPLYLLYRAANPMRDGEVPGFVSGLHKASIDIATGAQLMLLHAERDEVATGSVHQFVEHHGLLVGSAGVCAGPPLMIEELTRVMSDDGAAPAIDSGPAEKVLGELTGLVSYVDAVLELTVARQFIGAHLRRHMAALRTRCASIGAAGPRERDLFERLCDVLARHPVPTRPSEIIQRQDQLLLELPADRYVALVDALDDGRAALTSSAAHATGTELLAHIRGTAPLDEAEVRQVIQLAGRRGDPLTTALAEAIVDSAQLERRALAFYTSIETAICRALGRDGSASRLMPDQLARVFGPSPARYLGQLVGISVASGDGQIAYSAAPREAAPLPLSL